MVILVKNQINQNVFCPYTYQNSCVLIIHRQPSFNVLKLFQYLLIGSYTTEIFFFWYINIHWFKRFTIYTFQYSNVSVHEYPTIGMFRYLNIPLFVCFICHMCTMRKIPHFNFTQNLVKTLQTILPVCKISCDETKKLAREGSLKKVPCL